MMYLKGSQLLQPGKLIYNLSSKVLNLKHVAIVGLFLLLPYICFSCAKDYQLTLKFADFILCNDQTAIQHGIVATVWQHLLSLLHADLTACRLDCLAS